MSTHGLASLSATYTDSEPEGEDEDKDLQDSKTKSDSGSDRSEEATQEVTEPELPEPLELPAPAPQKVATLVSYNDDVEDEDADAEGRADGPPSPIQPGMEVELPPEPSGRISPRLLEKVAKLYERKDAGVDVNALIQNRKDFRNPSIYEKLIQFCGIHELGTNYPPYLYDPLRWGKQSFYEELARVQKIEMDKLEKDKKDKDKTRVEFVSGTKKSVVEDDPKKRKSKWDQVGVAGAPMRNIAPSGPKTILSAFGSLPKKPRL